MASKKKTAGKPAEEPIEPGFFSDYGYGSGALILHNPPIKPKNSKPAKGAKGSRIRQK